MAYPNPLQRSTTSGSGTDATSFEAIAAATSFTAASTILCWVAADGNPTLTVDTGSSNASWAKVNQWTNGTAVTVAMFRANAVSAGSNRLVVTSSASQQFGAVWIEFDSGLNMGNPIWLSSDTGGSGAPNPASVTHDAGENRRIAIGVIDGSGSITAAPTIPSMTNFQASTSSGTGGVAIASAEYDEPDTEDTSSNPNAFSSSSAAWIALHMSSQRTAAYSMAANAGSYAYTGTAAALRRALKMVAATGAYAKTGTAATLRRGYNLIAAAGTYDLSGTAATFQAALRMIAEAATYAQTGTDAALRRGYTTVAETAAYLVNGTDAAFRSARTMIAAAGSYALDGADAVFQLALTLLAGSGSYTQDGTDVDLTADLREFGTGPTPGERSVRPRMERRVVRDHSRRRIIRP